jgi:hypothetical protein
MKGSWVTTVLGCVIAICVAIQPLITTGVIDWKQVGFAALIAAFGFFTKQYNVTGGDKSNHMTVPPGAKILILAILMSGIGFTAQAQINTRHFFSAITKEDVVGVQAAKTLKTAPISLAWFLRGKIAETAYEVPLFHGGGGQLFSATGVGLSLAAYNLSAVELFSVDAILYAPNTDLNVNGISTALAIGIPIPKLNLPNINIGIREDWKAKVTYLQTSITFEF